MLQYKYYVEQYQKPMIVPEADYTAGTVFLVGVKYLWFGSPFKDYTVKVYSKQTLTVRDNASGGTSVINMDGQSPSGFTASNYTGMSNTGPFGPQPGTTTTGGNTGGNTDGGGSDGGITGGDGTVTNNDTQ